MNKKWDKHFLYLDLTRVIACIAILLYHLNILKGGYLAVCTFLVLSGYLSTVSLLKKDNFSIKDYYISRLKRIYLPLIIVIFLVIPLILSIKDFTWLNIKKEVLSILLGYNNFWQISANLDYFAHNVASPFMHLWYVSLIIQFELIFPFIFKFLNKLSNKFNQYIPIIITTLLGIISIICFYKINSSGDMMVSYYHPLTRSFSLLFGVSLAFIHDKISLDIPNILKRRPFNKIIYYSYILILILLFIYIPSDSKYFCLGLIITTFISLRLISYTFVLPNDHTSIFAIIIKYLSSISYEIYLLSYPIMFYLSYISLNNTIRVILVIIITIILSSIIHYAFKKEKNKLTKIISLILICTTIYGLVTYITTKDYSKDLKNLEKELNTNAANLQKKQELAKEEYQASINELENQLNKLKEDTSNVEEIVKGLPIIGIGDSVMLGAIDNLYDTFTNGYFDAKISRTSYVVNDILKDLDSKNMLGNPIVFSLGTNGDCSTNCKEEIMNTLGDREVFWLTVTNDNDVHFNSKLTALAEKYPNIHIIDWQSISSNHPEYFVADKIHLTAKGRTAYTTAIYEAIIEYYSNKYEQAQKELIADHEQKEKDKITFYGNDLLLNAFNELEESFPSANYLIKENFTPELLINELESAIENNTLTNRLVFAFDDSIEIDYESIVKLVNQEIYVVTLTKPDKVIDGVTYIDFSEEIVNNNYLMVDNIHLNKTGSAALIALLNEALSDSNP